MTKHPANPLLVSTLLGLLTTPAATQAVGTPDGEAAARVDAVVREALEASEAVGLSVAVAVGDELVLAEGYGLAEVEHDAPADAETLFRIGSITKQFTAAAIVRLAERGELEIDAPMTEYLPDYPTHGHEITVRHLLTHTSGIPSYTGMGERFWGQAAVETDHEGMIALWKDLPLEFTPGDRFLYDNSGYYLLGMIVEVVSDKGYAEFLEEEFFGPLGLEHLRYDSNSEIVPNRAQGYGWDEGVLVNDGLLATSKPGAAGALMASAADLVRWQLALVSGRVVAPASYEQMTEPFLLNDVTESSYGFGLRLTELDGRRCIQHGGGIFGFNSDLLYLPEERISVAVISNCEAFSSAKVSNAIARALLEETAGETR